MSRAWFKTAAAVALIAFVFLTWRWIVSPDATDLEDLLPADAIVMFGGGEPERIDAAQTLMSAGVAPVLVIASGVVEQSLGASILCAGGAEFEVLCPSPGPDSTRGQAQGIADLAAERDWDRLVMVTSTYNLGRAELLLGRCYHGQLLAYEASPDLSIAQQLSRVGDEWLGHIKSRVWTRGC